MSCRSAALPGDPQAFHADTSFAVDSLVDAILDAIDPNVLTVSDRVGYRDGDVCPIVLIRLNAAQWELSLESWARAAGELARRSRSRPLNLPSLAGVMDTLMTGGQTAIRHAADFGVRGAH